MIWAGLCWAALAVATTATAHAQELLRTPEAPALAPAGYSGTINTPTAAVLPWGTGVASYTGNNPERVRVFQDGAFGSLNLGFGALPGLEIVGRLAVEGNIACNQYLPDCPSGLRDLSVGAKYQLPLHLLPWKLPFDTRVALGFTDYGGAATNFRQTYAVATGTWKALDLSLGYSHPGSRTALMDGAFASAALRLPWGLAAVAEHDTRNARLGFQYRTALSDNTTLQAGFSRNVSGTSNGQPWQGTVALQWRMGAPATLFKPREERVLWAPAASREAAQQQQALAAGVAAAPGAGAVGPAAVNAAVNAATDAAGPAAQLAAALRVAGFTQVVVRFWPESTGEPAAAKAGLAAAPASRRALWWVRAEPLRWRPSRAEALGVLLGQWATVAAGHPGDLMAELTYMGQPTVGAYGDAICLPEWLAGGSPCTLDQALQFLRAGVVPETVRTRARGTPQAERRERGPLVLWPRLEVGPGLRTIVGSEYGVVDYSLAAELGAEVQLAPGLFWQGVLSAPVRASDDYQDGGIYSGRRHPSLGMDSALLTYFRPLGGGVLAQASAGYIDRRYKGGQVDVYWSTPGGRWRFNVLGGRYQHDVTGVKQAPLLAGGRWSVLPGRWQAEVMAGRFLGGDKGASLTSRHWFGDTQVALYARSSEGTAGSTFATRRSFIGFTLSRPLGTRRTVAVGPVGLRLRDRFSWGQESKVAESDNYITAGYGEVPRLRHGLYTDGTDYDRTGAADLRAAAERIRAAARYAGPVVAGEGE